MKKLLSICFLSILLGLLSFSTRAQSSGGSNCASGFWIQNLQPDTISGIVNLPADMPNTGKLPLSHTLGSAYYSTISGSYLGNAHPQVTELYELHFCNTCGLDPKTKVSVDWLLYRDGQLVNDNLSDYVDFAIYTLYSKLNQYGQCQSIEWLGGKVPNEFGYCTQIAGNYSLYDTIHGLNGPCNDPANYPGAMQVEQGTPMAVLTQLGQIVPANGMVNIYSEHLDYFYLDFFQQTRTIVQLKWKQVGNYKLVMRIRERVGGTPWNNLTWNENETTDFIGGHQSCCGRILAEDSIDFPYLGEFSKEVCENEHYIFGRPEYDFHVTMPDTNVVFGQYVFDNTDCKYFQTDSIYRFHFFVRNTPEVVVLKQYDTLCKCSSFGPEQLLSMIRYDSLDLEYASDHKFMWYYWGANGYGWYDEMPDIDTVVGTYTYVVRQVNTYTNFNQFYSQNLDTVVCAGEPVTLYVTFLEMDPPVVPAPADICLEVIDSAFIHNVTAQHDPKCANTTRWYKTVSTSFHNNKTEYLTDLVYTGDDFPIHMIDYIPATNIDKTVYFYAVSYDETRNCESKYFTTYTVRLHQTPELVAVAPIPTVICPGSEATLKVKINNNPNQTDNPYTYKWNGDVTEVNLNGTRVPFVADTVYTVGNGTGNTPAFPLSNEAKYNYTQQIFTASEVGAGEITKIAFEYAATTALTRNNVKIYLGTTTTSSFNNSNKQWVEGGTLVYDGAISFNGPAGWKEIELQNSFVYDGTQNLVVTIDDQSNVSSNARNFKYTNKTNTCMRAYGSNPNPTNKTVASTRNNMKFFAEGTGFTTNSTNQTAYNQTDPTDSCRTAYQTTVYVIDANGCKSEPVVFNYISNDTINPTVNKATVTTDVYACHLDLTNAPVYTTVAALEAGAGVIFSDNCDKDLLTIANVSSVVNSISDTTCHEVVTRTYTVKDHCGNPVTFTQVFVSQDTTKPSFVFAPGEFPLIRLFPVEGGNCTFNSPDSMTFVNAVAPHVFDNCTDSAYLMSTLKFFWENTDESPINGVDIFKKKNHLSVVAQITDRCGNVFAQDIIFLDRPEHIAIKPNAITSTGNQCFGDTATLHFDVTYITDDTLIGPFVPYTYEWIEVNGREVTFTAVNDTTTEILFPGTGDYTFIMKVTDRNGCYAETEPVVINVRPLPQLVINHIVLNGQTEPYCPTYGNLTIRAEVIDAVPGQTVDPHAFVWTGESVNTMSDSARTWVTIVPEWCDTMYYPTVTVTDDRGCVGTLTDTIEAKSFGPQFINTIPDTIVEKMPGCVFKVPDFHDLIDANLVTDDCYTFSQLKYSDAYGTIERTDWYTQVPAAGTEFTEAVKVVTITIKNPCGETATLNVNAVKPTDVLTVSIDPATAAECQDYIENTGVVFTTAVENAVGSVDYEWTRDNNTTVLGTNATYTAIGAMEPGTYTYQVDVEDALGCTASATADLTVYFQGADPVLRKYPNTLCERFNGALIVDVAPTGYAYDLQHNDFSFFHFFKISDNPDHQPTEWNTIAFDSLRPGWYTLTVYTDHDCERSYQVYIENASQAPNAPTFTKVDVTVCTNDNGQLTINALPGFTYEVYSVDATTGAMTLVGTSTSYNNLPVGTYYIEATQTSTHCKSSVSVDLLDAAPRPDPTYNITANSNCANNPSYNNNPDNVFNGQINITSNANWLYTVYTSANDTLLDGVTLNSTNNPIKNLAPATYYIVAYNPANGCTTLSAKQVTVGSNTTTPTINTTITPNHYCSVDTADGSIAVSNYSNFRLFSLLEKHGYFSYDTIAPRSLTHTWNSLYQGTYVIEAIGNNYCRATKQVDVQQSTINPVITATSTMNPSCVKDLGTITLKTTNASAMNATNYGNAHIASYKIEKGTFVWDTATTANQVTFNNVASGVYTYTATTQYGCTKTGTIEVEQYQLPAMQLDSTPNHMCAPTFEKPGDGTVTVVIPTTETVPGAHFFMYYFYDAADVNMDVPYELPLTNTKYWLAAKRYHVVAKDTVTGCQVEGYITVEDSLYQVVIDSIPTTPTTYCSTVDGDGTLTIFAHSTNPDAVLNYSLDNINWQSSNVFTGLANKIYNIYVKDTVALCETEGTASISYSDCVPTITIVDNDGNNAPFTYCIGDEPRQLIANAYYEDGSECAGTFTYEWNAPCSDPSYSNTNMIDVIVDHVMPAGCLYVLTVHNELTGCSYDTTVRVIVNSKPVIGFVVNDVQYTQADLEEALEFCENVPIHIQAYAVNGKTLVDTNWTLGYVGQRYQIDTIGTTMADTNTFCVWSTSDQGCVSNIASLPIVIKRIDRVTVPVLACDGTCTINNPDGTTTNITKPATATYPYTTTEVRTYTSVLKGCDSIVTYNITLIAAPEITGTPTVAPFCESENKTLADFEAGYAVSSNDVEDCDTIWIAADLTSASGPLTYSKITSKSELEETDYVITNASGEYAMRNTVITSGPALNRTTAVFTDPSADIVWSVIKNSDNTYSFYNASVNKYVALNSNNNAATLVDNNTSNATKWNISNELVVTSVAFPSRYLQYNSGSPRFAAYASTQQSIAFYKAGMATALPSDYAQVPSTTALTYDYVTTHDIKRVAMNGCGADTATLNLTVYKDPAINAFVAGNGHCAGDMYAFTANISTFGTPATAKLFIEGNTTPLATTTVNGLNQDVTFPAVKLPWAYNNKHITLQVVNNSTPCCATVTVDSLLVVDTAMITDLANSNTYCVGDEMKLADFSGIVPANYTSITLKHMVGTDPAPASDPVIALPYTFTDRSMDGEKVYVDAANKCYNQIISNVVTLKVDSIPAVDPISNIDVCASAFTLPTPTVNAKGGTISAQGWLLKGTSGTYATSTVAAIKDAARDHVVNAAYYATNGCGSDTSFFTVLVNDKPEVSLSTVTMCPNAVINTVITPTVATVNFHNINGGTDNVSYFVAKKTGVRTVIDITTATFNDIASYNELWFVAENTCGKDSAKININVLTNTFVGPTLKPACDGDQLSAFIKTAPSWTGTATVTSETWQVLDGSTWTNATTSTVINVPGPQVRYAWTTSCGDVITTTATNLIVNQKPELTLTNVAAVCSGSTIDPASAISSVTYHGNQDKYDTVYTVDGVVVDNTTVYTDAYNNKYLVVTLDDNGEACGIVKDSVKITINPLPVPTIDAPNKVCSGVDFNVTAGPTTGITNYEFFEDGVSVQDGASNIYVANVTVPAGTPLGQVFPEYSVTVTDVNGCVGSTTTNAVVKVTTNPEFIFRDMDGNETHEFTATTGDDDNDNIGLQYTWQVGVDCFAPDSLVFVEYDIYFNGELISNATIGEYLATVTTTPTVGDAQQYVTTNTFDWYATDGNHRVNTSLYNYAVANPDVATAGNHFPNTNLGLGTGHDIFDDLWLSFLAPRQVTKTIVPFRQAGEYKIVYRLKSTSHYQQLNYYYSPTGAPISELIPMGGHNALNSGANIQLLAMDSVTIHVTGPNYSPVTSSDVLPEVTPGLVVDETQVSPDMEVWPNPAPAVTTTLKARVHNMAGEANVTLTSLSGKQVYNGKTFIDNDNYYFEFDVNSLSVGSYILTVRTNDAIVTKKVIVTVLAR